MPTSTKTPRSSTPSHLDIAHFSWEKALNSESVVVDATCGNGQDALAIAKCLGFKNQWKGPLDGMTPPSSTGSFVCMDVQIEALEKTKKNLRENQINCKNISFIQDCHSKLDLYVKDQVDLIVYNLGYLPGSDKTVKTTKETTLLSIQKAMKILKPNGLISIACYPGHEEGKIEKHALYSYVKTLDTNLWSVYSYEPLYQKAPSLLLISKRK